jgi:hypothetical protein
VLANIRALYPYARFQDIFRVWEAFITLIATGKPAFYRRFR